MGSFEEMVVRRETSGSCTLEEARAVSERASQCGIGCLVLPKRLANDVSFEGLILDYDEFYFAVANAPYLFANGVFCIFDNHPNTNFTLYKNLEKLKDRGYRSVLYCNENMVITADGKAIRECMDGYTIPVEKL